MAGDKLPAGFTLPPYNHVNPHLWFAQLEEGFKYHKITTSTAKYQQLVRNLCPELAQQVQDIIMAPTQGKYEDIKAALLDRITASAEVKLQALLAAEGLGDRTPSQMLRHIQMLTQRAESGITPQFVRSLFLQKLPPNIRHHLLMAEDKTLEQIGRAADQIFQSVNASQVVVAQASMTSPLEQQVERLTADLKAVHLQLQATQEDLQNALGEIRRRPRSPGPDARRVTFEDRRRSPGPDTRRSTFNDRRSSPARGPWRGASPRRQDSTLCFYHDRFGSRAYRCTQPCTWQGNDRAGI